MLLESEKLGQYIEMFEKNGIVDVDVFSELDQNDLKDMGMSVLGDRKRVMLAIKKLSSSPRDSQADLSDFYESEEGFNSGRSTNMTSTSGSPRPPSSMNTFTKPLPTPPGGVPVVVKQDSSQSLSASSSPNPSPRMNDAPDINLTVSPRQGGNTSFGVASPGRDNKSPSISPRGSPRQSTPVEQPVAKERVSTFRSRSASTSTNTKLQWWMPDWFSDPEFVAPDLAHQSVATGPATDTSSPVFRDARWPHFLVKSFRSDVQTLWDNFSSTVKAVPQNKFLATRKVTKEVAADGTETETRGKYEWFTYLQIYQEVMDLTRGLASLGFNKGNGIGIFSKNRKEYVVTELASYALGGYNTAIYDTFGVDSAVYVVNHSEIIALLCTSETLPMSLSFSHSAPNLRVIICADHIPASVLSEWHSGPTAARIQLITFDDVIIKGKNSSSIVINPPTPDDVACIMYTSGTTGMPKGVLLSHCNFMSSVCGMLSRFPLFPGDRFISYLPLSHVLERSVMHAIITFGGESGFYSGDVKNLVDDIQELKPTVIPGVPRVYERIYNAITAKVAAKSGLAQKIFNKAYVTSAKALRNGKKPSVFWEKLVFSNIKKNLGGRVRALFSGGAPLNKRTQEYLSIVFACPLLQGYGLTETTGACCASYLDDSSSGHNGPPTADVEIKLVDCPEMNYFHVQTPPTGEICVRGPGVTKGYFKEPALTADALDDQGWFHTGDIGRLTPTGTIQIIDRKKNIFKLSQGLYIAAEQLEGMYALSPFVSQIWIPGDSNRSFIVAVVVPSQSYVSAWAEEVGLDMPLADLCRTPELHDVILRDLQLIHKENQRPGYELLRGIILDHEEWTPDGAGPGAGLLSPTFKLKRNALKAKYSFKLKQLCDSISEQ